MKYGIAIDSARCMACYACFMACKDEHCGWDTTVSKAQPHMGQFWMNIKEWERGDNERRIKTATGSVEAVAELTASIRPGIIFTPSHFTGTSPHAATRSKPINAILPNYWDRVSAQFNGVGCTLEKA